MTLTLSRDASSRQCVRPDTGRAGRRAGQSGRRGQSRLLHELDPHEVEAMKKQPSGSIVSQLTRHGLIDEYQLVVRPIFLGSGRALLSGVSKSVRLELLEVRKYHSGDVLLRYARTN
jgi:hypothetical protein